MFVLKPRANERVLTRGEGVTLAHYNFGLLTGLISSVRVFNCMMPNSRLAAVHPKITGGTREWRVSQDIVVDVQNTII